MGAAREYRCAVGAHPVGGKGWSRPTQLAARARPQLPLFGPTTRTRAITKGGSMSAAPALRALPARPSLEFERKEAKALLRRLRAGDPDAVARARVRHPRFDAAHA